MHACDPALVFEGRQGASPHSAHVVMCVCVHVDTILVRVCMWIVLMCVCVHVDSNGVKALVPWTWTAG